MDKILITESEEGQYKKTQDETAITTPNIPIPAYSSIVSIMESGYNPFHVVLGEEFLPLGYFSLENFWGQPLITEPAEAFVSTQGVIHMKLRWGYRIDLTMNKGIRVINEQSQIALAVSCGGNSMSMVHPMGCVLQEDQKIDIKLNNSDLDFPNLTSNPKFAKMNSSSSGIMFKCKLSPLGFVVDEAGVRSSMQRYYNEFKEDPTVTTFYDKAVTGPTYLESAAVILRATVRWVDFWGVDHWLINGVHITQTYDGSVGYGKLSCFFNVCHHVDQNYIAIFFCLASNTEKMMSTSCELRIFVEQPMCQLH